MLAPAVLAAIWAGGWIWEVVATGLALIAMFEWLSVCGVKLTNNTAILAALSLPLAGALFHVTGSPIVAVATPSAFAGMIRTDRRFGLHWLGFPIILGVLAASFIRGDDLPDLVWLPIFLSAFCWPFLRKWRGPANALRFPPVPPVAADGLEYVGLGYAALLVLRASPGGFGDVLFVMLIIWSSDVGAYLAGRLIGGPKLWPAISPGKTWAGAIGGLLAAIVIAATVAANFPHDPATILRAILFAALLSITGQAGDLMESALKRHFGRKDSGTLIPGHGGLLDRVDGLLAAAPVAMLLRLTTHGVHLWQ